MLSTIVKISNVTNLSDARYCAGMGVEMLGFALDAENTRHVTPEKFGEIRSWIAGVQLVGETDSDDAAAVLGLLTRYPVDALQISVPAMVPFLASELTIPLLLRIDVDTTSADELAGIVSAYGGALSYLLLESPQNAPVSDGWEAALKQLPARADLLLGFGLDDSDQIQALVDRLPVKGISLQGSDELRPGYKDYGALMDILEALETD